MSSFAPVNSEPPPDPYVGKLLAGRYRILRKLGTGGMGSVYEGQHERLGRRVAVKLLHARFMAQADVVHRFMNEGRAAGTLGHPHIVESLDVGRADDGVSFLVFEYLEGRTLRQELERTGPMPVDRALQIALQVISGLAEAHERGIIHRDITPDNVFLTERNRADHAKLLDFGISKFEGKLSSATRTGTTMGTPFYMPPEQIHDASRIDRRADVYAVGALLYQMLSGARPFEADNFASLVVKVMQERPVPLDRLRPDVPPALAAAIDRAMARHRDDRWPDMNALGQALRSSATPGEGPPQQASIPPRRPRSGAPDEQRPRADIVEIPSAPRVPNAPDDDPVLLPGGHAWTGPLVLALALLSVAGLLTWLLL